VQSTTVRVVAAEEIVVAVEDVVVVEDVVAVPKIADGTVVTVIENGAEVMATIVLTLFATIPYSIPITLTLKTGLACTNYITCTVL
jgi:hypothetical protein